MNANTLSQKAAELAKRHQTLIENFSFLFIIQVFNMILPLITYPYLIRTLGKETYGLIIYASALVSFATICVNFGLNISAIKHVASHRNDSKKLSEILSAVTFIKMILFIIIGFIFFCIVFFIPTLKQNWLIYLFSFTLCLGNIVFPVWFFQGMEKMKYITYIEVSVKSVFAGMVFVLIHSPDDYLWLPVLISSREIAAGIISLCTIFHITKVSFIKVSLKKIVFYVKESFPFLLSRISAVINDNAITLIIGSYLGLTEVAYFDLVNKVISILRVPFNILNVTIYPYMARTKNKSFLKKALLSSLAVGLFLYAALCLMSKFIILILAGKDLLEAQPLFYLFGLMLPIASLLHVLGNTALVVMGYNKESNLSIIYGSIIFMIIISVLIVTNTISLYALINAMLAHNIFSVIYRYYYCKKYNIV